MRKGIIVNLKRFKLLDYVTRHKILIVLCLLFVCGIALGSTVLLKNTWLAKNSQLLFKNYISVHIDNILIKKFLICVTRYIFILLVYFLSGASMLGVAVTPFVTLWQGIFIGGMTSYLYASAGLSGIAFNAIILVPSLSAFSVCCFFAAKCSIEFSLGIAKLTLPKSRPASLCNSFKNYCYKYLVYVGVTLVCAIFEIVLNSLFLKYFNF